MREMEATLFNAETAKYGYSHGIILAGLRAKEARNTTSGIQCLVKTLQTAWGKARAQLSQSPILHIKWIFIHT